MATKKKSGPGKAYVTIEGEGTDKKVVPHASKKDANAYGMEQRRQGKTIFAHSSADAEKHGLLPRESVMAKITKLQANSLKFGAHETSKARRESKVLEEKARSTAKSGDYKGAAKGYKTAAQHAAFAGDHARSGELVNASKAAVAGDISHMRAAVQNQAISNKAHEMSRETEYGKPHLHRQAAEAHRAAAAHLKQQGDFKYAREHASEAAYHEGKAASHEALVSGKPRVYTKSDIETHKVVSGSLASQGHSRAAKSVMKRAVQMESSVASHAHTAAKAPQAAPARLKPQAPRGQERPPAGSHAKQRERFHQAKVQHHISEASQSHAKTMKEHSGVVAATHLDEAKGHAIARKGALATIARGKGVQAGRKAPVQHALQKGKRGGTFYLSEGKKVYAKK